MLRRSFLLLVLLAAACRERLTATEGELRAPQRFELPRAFVGQVKRAPLEVTNTGLAKRELTASTTPPFSIADEQLTMPGASTIPLEVTFAPTDAGTFEQPLRLESEGQTLDVLLVGTGDPPLDCASSSPCRSSTFDVATGSCIETATNEGADCTASNACYSAAHCVAGQCVGQSIDCDDHDACSTDICDPARGCVHLAATARCPAPKDPCHVSACDSAAGCIYENAPDGTRCGPSDCSTASVCILGVCEQRPVSEGSTCGDPSPCQPLGRCVANTCVRPPPTGLVIAWTHWAPEGQHVDWDSMADTDDNIYWRERDDGFRVNPDGGITFTAASTRVVSVKNDGRPRWSQKLINPQQLSIVDGVLVVRQFDSVEGRRLSDGEAIWNRNFSNANTLASVRTVSRGLGGSLYVGYASQDAGTSVSSTITSLNVFNGATLWQTHLPDQDLHWQTMPVDESGYGYAGTWQASIMKHRYVGLSPSGAIRWNIVNPHDAPAAVFGGRVYHWDHWLSETADGGWVNEEPPTLAVSGYPRLALGAISYVGSELVDAGSCDAPGIVVPSFVLKLVRVDPASSQVRWMLTISAPDAGGLGITNPVLTSRSTVIFSQTPDYCGRQAYALREISASGEASFSCPLPPGEEYLGEGLLAGGKWIAQIRARDGGAEGVRAVELPGFELPEHGWATAWGSSARDNHAR